MRPIRRLVVHCSATPKGLDIGVKEINAMHQVRGFDCIGYHYVIRENGRVEGGRAVERIGAHVTGYNTDSIGICLVGGLDHERKPTDTFTAQQFTALGTLLDQLCARFPDITDVCGHRDLSPDANHDGKIERYEWIKECPCFDVRSWWAQRNLMGDRARMV